jgi:Secretion system C-terminal sorting domain
MKKITFFALLMVTSLGFSQTKTTGIVNILPTLYTRITLDNATQLATMLIAGPTDRWFAVTFGGFADPGAMTTGNDMVYWNGTSLIDGKHNGQGISPTADAINNWTVVTNTVSGITRFITATRPFVADATDYTFNFANNNLSIAGARANTAILTPLQNHGGGNRTNFGSIPLTLTPLGLEDFSLNATAIYPNPSNGEFKVQTKTNLDQINIYSQTGQFVKTVDIVDKSNKVEVIVKGLSTGIYLIELKNATEKSWKKVVVK